MGECIYALTIFEVTTPCNVLRCYYHMY